MSASDLEYVSREDRAMESGVAAAMCFGELLQAGAGEAELYVPASLQAELVSLVAAVPDPLGGAVLRVVPDEAWAEVISLAIEDGATGQRLAPRAAVALDLMESGDPRYWVAAERLIETRG